ncbi:MAG: arginase, partial [Actinobacteria bacterium]|nr:arginase [Actinomycetota bacterium]
MAAGRQVAIIGAALDLGAGRRGVDMGPSAIRYAGLEERLTGLGYRCVDWGNVETAVLEATEELDERARYLPQILEACGQVAGLVGRALDEAAIPLVLGGDHSVALGTLSGLARQNGPGGVLWIDAHGDLNTPETSPTGNVHGMPLAAALGLADGGFESDGLTLPALDPRRVALVGLRSVDARERDRIRELGIATYT